MKKKSMISWALIFSFSFLLFQPLIEAREIDSARIEAQVAQLRAKYQHIDEDLQNYQKKSKTVENPLQVKKAKAEQNLMFDPNIEPVVVPDPGDGTDNSDTTSDTTSSDTSNINSTTADSTTTDSTAVSTQSLVYDGSTLDKSDQQEYRFMIMLQEQGELGEIIPITPIISIRDDINIEIGKVDLIITDPATQKESFKDSYINYKGEKRFLFTYAWDTVRAQSNPGSHDVIIRVYKKGENTPFQTVTEKINIIASPGIDIMKHPFWGAYLKQDGSLSDYWKNKIGCTSSDECKTRTQISDLLEKAVSAGSFAMDENGNYAINEKFNEADKLELNNSSRRYFYALSQKQGIPNDEAGKIEVSSYRIVMQDLVNLVQENEDIATGVTEPELSDETLKSADFQSVQEVTSDYMVKFSSVLDPADSKDDAVKKIQNAPFYKEYEAKLLEKVSTDPADQIGSFDELNPATTTISMNKLMIKKAKADPLVILGLVFIAIDIWNLCHGGWKDWKQWGMLVLDVALILIGGGWIFKGTKATLWIAEHAPWLWKGLAYLSKPIEGLIKFMETSKVGRAIVEYWGKLWSAAEKVPILGKVVKALGTVWKSHIWPALAGALKKLIPWGDKILQLLGFALLRNAWWSDTACPGISIFGKKGLDPFAWALCNIMKFFFDLGASIYGYSICLLKNALGTGNKPTQCSFKFGPI